MGIRATGEWIAPPAVQREGFHPASKTAAEQTDQLRNSEVGKRSFPGRLEFNGQGSAENRPRSAAQLKVKHIDSAQKVIRIEQCKGRKDRNVMLSPETLDLLRQAAEGTG
jgi:hypothetical protein